MFDYIKGVITRIADGYLVLENNDIGYRIEASNTTLANLKVNDRIKLFTYLSVKDDGISLLGFYSPEERVMFTGLVSVSGVGTKSGFALLSGMPLATLATAIACGDVKALSAIKGIGKKTAERIILELKEKVDYEIVSDKDIDISFIKGNTVAEDAVFALQALGFGKADSAKAVAEAGKAIAGAGNAANTNELITIALKSFNKR